MIISGFTHEEMARLLQFTTGCSQLPPGGFCELCPKFQITALSEFERLPSAHTWWVAVSVVFVIQSLISPEDGQFISDIVFISQKLGWGSAFEYFDLISQSSLVD